jgi:enamine deaminase RidA (YjgF/YER057c/UK114 family)
MGSKRVIQPAGWASPKGYSNGIIGEGKLLFIAGQIGWNPTSEKPVFPESFVEQFGQALDNVLAVLKEAGGAPADICRMTLYVTDKKAYLEAAPAIGAIWKKRMGREYPAMTLVQVAALLEPQALVEIEATAAL